MHNFFKKSYIFTQDFFVTKFEDITRSSSTKRVLQEIGIFILLDELLEDICHDEESLSFFFFSGWEEESFNWRLNLST